MRRRRTDNGNTLVEFVLALLLFILLLSGLIDATVYFVRFSLLEAATKHAVREIATTSFGSLGGAAVDCGFLTPYLDGSRGAITTARNYLSGAFGIDSSVQGITFTGQLETEPAQVTLRGEWPYHCFLCVMTGKDLLVSTVHRALLEDRCILASDPGSLKCCSTEGCP